MPDEVWISVDVETSGPTPATGSLIAIGACRVDRPEVGFYVELRPLAERPWGDAEERVHHLSREHLERHGLPRREAVGRFGSWIAEQVTAASAGASAGSRAAARPVFVGLNATFDWMWIADAFHSEFGANPFGPSGLDIKALYLGMNWGAVRRWSDTSGALIARKLGVEEPHVHHALDDARRQAEFVRRLLGLNGAQASSS